MKRLSLFFLFLLFPVLVFGQFGKNKVQYTDFRWEYLQSEHFDVYYYPGAEKLAEFVADVAESSYVSLRNDFRYDLVDRVKIIVYKSHNDFEQTNVSSGLPEESVGGFTEFFKNRVVIPFEGNYEQFRHVIHHELTHAVSMQMIYGAGVQSIVMGMMRFQIPLWLAEGLAEYESLRWDTESDMYIRDAALNGYLPPIQAMYGFMNYKGGQNVLYYIAQKYGNEKIGEILGKIKINKNVERGLKQSIGIGEKDLTKRWHKYVKKQYWPDIADRLEPQDFAKKMTDHVKYQNFINNSPALSPKGDKIAFLSNKSDYFDIYVMSAIDGKMLGRVVKGQQTMNLEELHWLKPGITWSPDGKRIAFSAKGGPRDVLHIASVRKRKIIKTYKVDLDGIFAPSWSPDGKSIAFSGIKNGESDLYQLNLKTGKITHLTNDIFSDLEPRWSPDGKALVFTSDRGPYTDPGSLPRGFKIQNHNYSNHDIYVLHLPSKRIERITKTKFTEKNPEWSPDGKKIVYVSDANGIFNFFVYNTESDSTYPITNVLTGVFQPSWVGDELAFTAFYDGGYDIYLMKNPGDIKPGDIHLKDTEFIKKVKAGKILLASTYRKLKEHPKRKLGMRSGNDFRHFVFGENLKANVQRARGKNTRDVFLDSTQYKLASGAYKQHPYRLKFTPDLVYGNAGYSQFFGVQGSTVLSLSDILGNHRIDIYSNLFYDMRNSDYQFAYYYLPHRVDIGVGAFHYAYFFVTGWNTIIRDRNYGGSFYLSYPFNRYQRLDFSTTFLGIDRRDLYFDVKLYQRRVLVSGLNYVKDTALWGWTGPNNGMRMNLSLTFSPGGWAHSMDFKTVRMDYRKYFRLKKDYTLACRLAGGASFGRNPQKFFLGGMNNWINLRFKGGLRIYNADDIYFSSFETPLRGYDYYEQIGTRFFLTNLEVRFPFIRYFIMGTPPIYLQNIRGTIFWDMGSAWENDRNFRFFSKSPTGSLRMDNVLAGYGFGVRVFLGYFLLRFDTAWKTNIATHSRSPRYYVSLGAEF